MRPSVLIACLLIGLAFSLTDAQGHDDNAAQNQNPKLLDFFKFKQVFHKKYGSLLEELSRQRLFMGRAIRAAISWMRYGRHETDVYYTVNPMSDWTREEFHATLVDQSDSLRALEAFQGEDLHQRSKRQVAEGPPEESKSLLKRLKQQLGSARKKLPSMGSHNDEVFFDHRKSGCLLPVKDQGLCGSCYIFSAIALYEWMYCKGNGGHKVAFSEQYVLDCGVRLGMRGCLTGFEDDTSRFVKRFGIELLSDYPYVARQETCPYGVDDDDDLQAAKRMGYGAFNRPKLRVVELEEFDKLIEVSPIIKTVFVSQNYQEYGGGVDSGDGCQSKSQHAMLLIGHGRQDGKEYWLFRSSHSHDWGERGHYKIAKGSQCLGADNGTGLVPGDSDFSFRKNANHNSTRIAEHRKVLGVKKSLASSVVDGIKIAKRSLMKWQS